MKLKQTLASEPYTDLETLEKSIVYKISESFDNVSELEFDVEFTIEEFNKFQHDVQKYLMVDATFNINNVNAKYTTLTFHGAKVNVYANR